MEKKPMDVDRYMENQAQRAKNLDPVNEVFTHEAEEAMVHFDEDLVSDSEESRSPTDQTDDEFSENLKSNIEQNLELEQ